MAFPTYQIRAPRPADPVYRMPRGFTYTAKGTPCTSKFKLAGRCKVQLTFKDGQPYLRFCKKAGKPGTLVPVNNPTEARILSERICMCLTRAKGKKNGGGEACLPKGLQLGRLPSRSRKRR